MKKEKTLPKDYDRWDGRVGVVITKRPSATNSAPKKGKTNAKNK